MAVDCRKCGGRIDQPEAGISTCPAGDELIYSYFRCPGCGSWTVELFHDRFLGDSFVTTRGPVPPEQGERDVARIRQCRTPHDKFCSCPVHQGW